MSACAAKEYCLAPDLALQCNHHYRTCGDFLHVFYAGNSPPVESLGLEYHCVKCTNGEYLGMFQVPPSCARPSPLDTLADTAITIATPIQTAAATLIQKKTPHYINSYFHPFFPTYSSGFR